MLEALEGRRRRRLECDEELLDLEPLPPGQGAPKGSPIVFLDDSPQKPAALTSEELSEFTCAICLDRPTTLAELATINACTHKFCFECIDTWAKTENRCPCCKARFRTIDRVESLPESSGRRSKRQRGGNKSPRNNGGVVNTRTVEDRNQPSGLQINFAFIEQILAQFSSISAEHGSNSMRGVFSSGGPNFVFSNNGGNPVMTLSRPGAPGGRIQFYLARDEDGRPGRGRVRYMREDVNLTVGVSGEEAGAARSAARREFHGAFGTARAPADGLPPNRPSPRRSPSGLNTFARRTGVSVGRSANAPAAAAGARNGTGRDGRAANQPGSALARLGQSANMPEAVRPLNITISFAPTSPSSVASDMTGTIPPVPLPTARRSPRAASSNVPPVPLPTARRSPGAVSNPSSGLNNNLRTEVPVRTTRRTTRSMRAIEGTADAPIDL